MFACRRNVFKGILKNEILHQIQTSDTGSDSQTRLTLYCIRIVDMVRLQMLTAYNSMYESLYAWRGGDQSAKPSVTRFGQRYLLLYSELTREAISKGDFVHWRIYPKHHMLDHCIGSQLATHGNAMDVWCYEDESEIGWAARVAESGHPSTLHRLVMEKHVI